MNNKISTTFNAQEIRAVMVDCYGTIVEVFTEYATPDHRVWRTLSNFMRYHGFYHTPENLCFIFEEAKHSEKVDCLETAGREPFDIQERNVYKPLMPSASDALLQTAAEIFRAETSASLRLYPGAEQFLTYINSRDDVKLCLMSNGQAIYTVPEMNALKITHLFDEINISSETFFRKPSRHFFRIMIDKLRIKPKHILMIGNHPGDDIKTAHAMGIHTCYIKWMN